MISKGDILRVEQFISDCKNNKDNCEDISDILNHKWFPKFFAKMVKKYENENKLFTYMITFTIDPKKHDVKNKKLWKKIEEYIIKFPRNKTCEIVRADLVAEGTDKDHKHHHWHLGLKCRKWFIGKTIKYYEKLYGNTYITKSNDNNYNNVLTYINKSVPSKQLPL